MKFTGRAALGTIVLPACFAAWAIAQPNPYCVSGANWTTNGVMRLLNMPGSATDFTGSQGYIWDALQTTNIANMVRPCKYWLMLGGSHKAHGYHEDTDTIDNPAAFQAWVIANPGRIWIIGNEPNGPAQDGLTPEQYARMFHTYYTFIKPLDPTARFAIAGLGGHADLGALQVHISWYDQALASYHNQFGSAMPVDIWNCHPYTVTGRLSPQTVLNDYIIPYHNYINTVEGGIYADRELWLTEFGVAVWSIPLNPIYINEFIRQACPVFEASGVIDRFFWFYGPWAGGWDPTMADVSLLGPTNQPTLIGETYSSLARTYPNPIPPPAPSMQTPPPPPLRITSDFTTTDAPWSILGGTWVLDAGAYRQTLLTGCGNAAYLPYDYRDVRVEFDVKINATSGDNTTYWAGATLRGGSIWNEQSFNHTWSYLVYLRRNGELGIYTAEDLTTKTVAGAVADTSTYHRIRIDIVGSRTEVHVDGELKAEWTDPNNRRSTGVVDLRTCRADASFDNVTVTELRPGDYDLDGDVDQADFGHMQSCFSGVERPQNDAACRNTRLDSDSDVDLNDLQRFFDCRTAPGLPSDRACLDS